jgi:hypothetical protein
MHKVLTYTLCLHDTPYLFFPCSKVAVQCSDSETKVCTLHRPIHTSEPASHISHLWTYGSSYGPAVPHVTRNAFDAGRYIAREVGWGWALEIEIFWAL